MFEKIIKILKNSTGWVGLALLTFRHCRKLGDELRDAGKVIFIRITIIKMGYYIVARKTALYGLSVTRKRLIGSTDDKINYIATRLSKNFLFQGRAYINLKDVAAEYLTTGGAV